MKQFASTRRKTFFFPSSWKKQSGSLKLENLTAAAAVISYLPKCINYRHLGIQSTCRIVWITTSV